MKVIIDQAVRHLLPELCIHFRVISSVDLKLPPKELPEKKLNKCKLTPEEIRQYMNFRKNITDTELLAAERLRKILRIEDLPTPDPITAKVINASYRTYLPITAFATDEFDTVLIRFSKSGETLSTNIGAATIKTGSLVADTKNGILGIFGIKSSLLGKFNKKSKKIVILSFGCSEATCIKSKKLIDIFSQQLLS